MDLETAVRNEDNAYAEMQAAHRALEDADPDRTSADDLKTFSRAFDDAERLHRQLKARRERAERVEAAKRNLPVAPVVDGSTSRISVTGEPLTYRKGEGPSFFADLAGATVFGDMEARDRIERHQREMQVEKRALNETAGTGGEFVPPLWMVNEWVPVARAGRPFANVVRSMPLPPSTNSINLPTVATGTATATQSDGGAVQSTDATTGSLNVPVKTIAGQQDLAQQLFDRSLPGIDIVIFSDLVRDYQTKLDVQTLNGSGSGANALGILNVAGTSTVTYTSGSPTVAGMYSKLADAIQRIHTLRFLPPEVIVMHPRRWAWFLAAVDSQNRPLVVPQTQAPVNVPGILENVASENIVGSIQGLPCVVDSSIPTTRGAGTNEDVLIVTRASDLYLFEDTNASPRLRTLQEVLSGTLQVRLQAWGYLAFTGARYPASTSLVTGSGCAAPVF